MEVFLVTTVYDKDETPEGVFSTIELACSFAHGKEGEYDYAIIYKGTIDSGKFEYFQQFNKR